MRDPIADGDRIRHGVVGIQDGDPELASVAGVDRAGAVHDRDAVACGESAARNHEADMPFGKRDAHSGSDRRALPRAQHELFRREQVGARITGMRIDGRTVTEKQILNVVSHHSRLVQEGAPSRWEISDRIGP